MATKTNSGLVEYAKAQVGLPYWYGTYGQKASENLYNSQKKTYPNQYTATDFAEQYGFRVHDCSGIIKGYLWSDTPTSTPNYNSKEDKSANGFYTAASTKGKISTFPKTAGLLLFKGSSTANITHVGVYGGDGYVYEAKSHSKGVCKTKYVESDWNYWAQCSFVTDDTTASPSSDSSETSSKASGFKAGDAVKLSKTPIYKSSTDSKNSGTKSGTYYIWDETVKNGRIRLTNKEKNVGVDGQVSFWVNTSDISEATSSSASGTSSALSGTYKVTTKKGLWIRKSAGEDDKKNEKIIAIPYGNTMTCDGSYDTVSGVKWLHVSCKYNGKTYTGYSCSTYLSKV